MTGFNLDPNKKPEPKPEKPKALLDEDDLTMLLFIEQKFWETGYLPTDEIISRMIQFPPAKIKRIWAKPNFREAMLARGVDLTPDDSFKVLKPKQLMLANALLNAHDSRSVREKLEALDVSSQQYYAWKRQPAFADYLRKRAEAIYAGTDSAAFVKLSQLVEEGDYNAIKLFFEMRGIYNPRVQVDVNIQGVLVKVVEIISEHVRDPMILEAIGTDIQALALEATGGR